MSQQRQTFHWQLFFVISLVYMVKTLFVKHTKNNSTNILIITCWHGVYSGETTVGSPSTKPWTLLFLENGLSRVAWILITFGYFKITFTALSERGNRNGFSTGMFFSGCQRWSWVGYLLRFKGYLSLILSTVFQSLFPWSWVPCFRACFPDPKYCVSERVSLILSTAFQSVFPWSWIPCFRGRRSFIFLQKAWSTDLEYRLWEGDIHWCWISFFGGPHPGPWSCAPCFRRRHP